MAAIKHTLQRQVFLPSEERLVAVVHVTKAGKKKKASFLCAAVTTEKPIQAYIYQVKKTDRGDNHFKKKLAWALRELRILDARSQNRDTAEFDMMFEKQYKWVASSIAEKNAFILCLWKLSQRYLVQKPEFNNVSPGVLEDLSELSEADKTVQQAEEMASAVDTLAEFNALSAKEESDLETLMSQSENAISNAEAFADQLAKDLSVLDGANIHSIMGSEDQVMALMVLIDEALQEACKVEEKLDQYDHKLQSVKELMEVMKDKDTLMQVRNNNHQRLLEELDSIITHLDLEHHHKKALLDGDLTTPNSILECTEAANALKKCMNTPISNELEMMAAVQEQRKRFKKLKTTFVQRLSYQLNNFFIHQGNDPGENLSRYANEQKLPKHNSSHRDLLPYAELMLWMKDMDRDAFTKLSKVYTQSLSKLYDREIKEFCEAAKQKIAPRLERKDTSTFYTRPDQPKPEKSPQVPRRADSTFYVAADDKPPITTKYVKKAGTLPTNQRHNVIQAGSSSSLNSLNRQAGGRASSLTTLDSDSQHGSDPDIMSRAKFDQMLEHVLCEFGPWCLAEQDFCVRFFHLTTDMDKDENQKKDADDDPVDESNPWVPQKPPTPKERQINKEVRQMMRDLFPSLESELTNFVLFGDRIDNFNSLYMLVRMSEHVINAEDTGSFLSKTYASCLVHIKRNFDKFIQTQLDNILECRVPRKGKVAILPFVHSFEEFAQQAEAIFRGSDRRNDLDKAYQRLVTQVFEHISALAAESHKTPAEVVKMENFHHMYAVLSQLKITSLETQRKEARQRYQEHQTAYVARQLGRPLEKLSVFFEGIESKVAQGVKLEEIGYQLAYSKQELRKLIKEYPGKEVKKNLDYLYKKLEKHLCEEENLLQVVWHSMQDEFLKQYKHFETLIAKCYPDSGITLEFTIGDLLGYFSDIAQSH